MILEHKQVQDVCILILLVDYYTETEEGIAQAIIRGTVDFQKDPWPKVSEEAIDLVQKMLNPNPDSRLTVDEVLGIYSFLHFI